MAMNTLATRTLLGASLVLLPLPTGAAGSGFDARVYPPIAFAPCNVLVQAFIEPDVRNRSVEFVVDSEAFYTSSTVQLDGDQAPRTKEVMFRRLPAGIYQVRVTLIGTDGTRGGAVRRVQVMATGRPQ
jgi:hypothetical protein